MVRGTVRRALATAVLVGTTGGAALAGWKIDTWRDNNGVDGAGATLKAGRHDLSLSCSRTVAPALQVLLGGGGFPNLAAVDDAEVLLTFRFVLAGGPTRDIRATFHYFAPDAAWVGEIVANAAFVSAFEKAATLEIRNPQGEKVLSLPLQGSAKAGGAWRKQCGLGK